MMKQIRQTIILVDDEQNIRRLISYDLKQASYDVFAFENGQEAYEFSKNHECDAFIVDWMMPVMNGLDLVKALRAEGNTALIMMLTAKSEEEDIIDAFEVGVDDYLTKPFSSRELLVRLKTHLNRIQSKHSPVMSMNGLGIDLEKRTVTYESNAILLTKIEFDVLAYLIKQRDTVISRDEILNELWGFDYDGDTRIVDVHISKLRSKLAHTSIEISSFRGVGYRLEAKHE